MASVVRPNIKNILRTVTDDSPPYEQAMYHALDALRHIHEGAREPMRLARTALDSIESLLEHAGEHNAEPTIPLDETVIDPPASGLKDYPADHPRCPSCGSQDTEGQPGELACHECGVVENGDEPDDADWPEDMQD